MPTSLRTRKGPRRVILYARVSRERRKQGRQRSVTQQLDIGRQRADELGYEVVGVYSDNDASASQYSTKRREDWPKVEASIQAGDADVLWVWEISRGTRDRVVWAHLVQACQEHQMWIALDDDEWDTCKPSHMKHLDDLMADAIYESSKTHTRTSRDVEANAERGGVHGPWGYGFRHEFDPHTGEFLRRVVYEPEAKHVRQMAQRYLSGWGLKTIAVDLNERQIPTATGRVAGAPVLDEDGNPVVDERTGKPRHEVGWQYQVVKQLLLRASLIGKRSHKGKIILDKGGHEAIFDGTEVEGVALDEAAWWQLRKKLLASAPSASESGLNSLSRGPVKLKRPRDGSAKRLVGGIGQCGECGAWVYPNPNKRSPHGWAYRCVGLYPGARSACVSRTGVFLDQAVEALVVARFSRPDALEAFRAQSRSPEQIAEAAARKAVLDAEMDDLVADVAAGRVSRRLAAADEARIEAELSKAAAEMRPEMVEPLAVELADPAPWMVQRTWRDWTVQQQRRALRVLTRKIVLPRVGPGRRRIPPQEYVHIVWVGEES